MTDSYAEGQILKKNGMEAARYSYPHGYDPVYIAQCNAHYIAFSTGSVTVDQVRDRLAKGEKVCTDALKALDEHSSAWGSVFKTPYLVFSGQVVESQRKERHGNLIRVWHYKAASQ